MSNNETPPPPAPTPAPWRYAQRKDCYVVVTPRRTIGEVYAHHPDIDEGTEGEANARLIAAAPELLDFAEKVFDYADTGKGFEIEDNESLLVAAKEVIAKATGQS